MKKIKRDRGIKYKIHNGYVFIKVGEKFLPEHRLVTEEVLGRLLNSEEKIHHKDLNKTNNHPSNLMLFPNQEEHARYHIKLIKFPYKTNPMKREEEEKCILNLTNRKV